MNNTLFTHIKIEMLPQRLDENFTKNCDIADEQKKLAESAPELLFALCHLIGEVSTSAHAAEYEMALGRAAEAIAKATRGKNA